jgi:hypothetical protein
VFLFYCEDGISCDRWALCLGLNGDISAAFLEGVVLLYEVPLEICGGVGVNLWKCCCDLFQLYPWTFN